MPEVYVEKILTKKLKIDLDLWAKKAVNTEIKEK